MQRMGRTRRLRAPCFSNCGLVRNMEGLTIPESGEKTQLSPMPSPRPGFPCLTARGPVAVAAIEVGEISGQFVAQ
jgi:hypothetical protein